MAHKIQIKRGNKADLPTLDAGEFGLCQDTNELFIGNDGNQKIFPIEATDISIADTGGHFTSTNVEGALDELFTSVSNGKTALVSDIEDKGGTVSISGDIPTFEELSDGIGTIPTGGGGTPVPVSPKDVNFCDYDGTIVASYTLAQAQALSALPTAPDHSSDTIPLTFQGWNYTLAQVNALTDNANIGATYIPTDGKTHLTIHIAEPGRMVVPLHFNQTVANGVTIDWGDGSPPETLTGTGNRNTTHTYSAAGTYDITLDVTSGVLGLGANSSSYCVLGSTGNNGRVYCNMLKSVRIGNSVTTIGNYAFNYCYSLASVIIPHSVTTIGNYAFRYCYSLASVIIPHSVTTIGNYAFAYCSSLASVIIPHSVTTIGNYAFGYCSSLASVIIPNSVTTIGDYAFGYCYGTAHYYVYRTTPPTLGGTSVFVYIPSDCVIHVPAASLSAYQSATNWTAHAAKMVGDL
jgi:hypothetical protein